jgi:hypothetical protein
MQPGEILLTASSDLSYYEDVAGRAARRGVVACRGLDADGLMDTLERELGAKWGGPMAAVPARRAAEARAPVAAIRRLKTCRATTSVVGYMAAAIW